MFYYLSFYFYILIIIKLAYHMTSNSYKRLIEIDVLKGIAVISMIIFHIFYMINEMNISHKYSSNQGLIKLLAEISHNLFIFMVGVNLVISYQNYSKQINDDDKINHHNYNKTNTEKYHQYIYKQLIRATKIFMAGIVMNIVSYILFPEKYIIFGIFSFISSAIILSQPFVFYEMRYITLLIGLLIIYINILLKTNIDPIVNQTIYNNCIKHPLKCFISGIKNVKYVSLDYFPLIPNMGIIFLGIFVAHLIYEKGNRIHKYMDTIDSIEKHSIVNIIALLGKYSFEIYFIHFFLIYVILLLYKKTFKS